LTSDGCKQAGSWALEILKCPIPQLSGPQGAPDAPFAATDLAILRNLDNFRGGNLARLKAIGSAAFSAVTNNAVRAALQASIAHAAQQQHGLRIVFSLVPTEQEAGPVRLSEIPIEALYEPRSNFLAPQINTPVSRSLQAQPDRDPIALTPPLRVLVIAAGPTGLPPADIAQERAAITDALANLVANRIVELDFCDPPTRVELARRFTTKYHVVHFVGHGGVGRTGSDPSPRAFVFLQDANKKPDPLDGESLDLLLRNNPSVRLVVITGCSTARLPPAVEEFRLLRLHTTVWRSVCLAQATRTYRRWWPCSSISMHRPRAPSARRSTRVSSHQIRLLTRR
jgi:CHAT domain